MVKCTLDGLVGGVFDGLVVCFSGLDWKMVAQNGGHILVIFPLIGHLFMSDSGLVIRIVFLNRHILDRNLSLGSLSVLGHWGLDGQMLVRQGLDGNVLHQGLRVAELGGDTGTDYRLLQGLGQEGRWAGQRGEVPLGS